MDGVCGWLLFFNPAGFLRADCLTGMAAMAFPGISDLHFAFYQFIDFAGAGVYAFAAVSTFISVDYDLPHWKIELCWPFCKLESDYT